MLALLGCTSDNSKPKFVEKPMDLNGEDGGEVRIENLAFPDGIIRTLTTAYFLAHDDAKMPFPIINMGNTPLMCNYWNEHIYPFGGASATIGRDGVWTSGGWKEMDVGDHISLAAADGSLPGFELDQYDNFLTPFTGGMFHDISYNPPAAPDPLRTTDPNQMGGTGANLAGQKLAVSIPGGPDHPDPVTLTFENGFAGVEIPPRPVVPGWAQAGQPSQMSWSRSQPLTVTYPVPASAPPDMLGFVAVFRLNPTEVFALCVHTHPGNLTLPASFMNTLPNNGILFVAHLLHRNRTFDNVRRIDMVGTACTSTAFTMTP